MIKWGIYLLQGLSVRNRSIFPSRPTGSIDIVLTDVHRNFWQNYIGILDHQKQSWTKANENQQNEGFTYFVARLTLKMDLFSRQGQLGP